MKLWPKDERLWEGYSDNSWFEVLCSYKNCLYRPELSDEISG